MANYLIYGHYPNLLFHIYVRCAVPCAADISICRSGRERFYSPYSFVHMISADVVLLACAAFVLALSLFFIVRLFSHFSS